MNLKGFRLFGKANFSLYMYSFLFSDFTSDF